MYYPTIPADINKAIEKIIWFYKCGKEDKKASSNRNSTEKVLDYNVDADYIYSAFMSQYNIDLQDIEYLHWWKFRALFDSLDENVKREFEERSALVQEQVLEALGEIKAIERASEKKIEE